MTESKGISTSNESGSLILHELNKDFTGVTDSLVSTSMLLGSIVLYIIFGCSVLIALKRIFVWLIYLVAKHPEDPIFPTPIKQENHLPSKMQQVAVMTSQSSKGKDAINDLTHRKCGGTKQDE
ncbi:hypothetical protein [Listeria booriae]|uniref:hypothetical protein n=1 Tax=Listeria booriae TaxID=1552123 RepID=UPI001E2DE1F5|nr:hypothetical protein [Listeria booriae]MCD2208599.1 hypothetical protein [Listeria booriae]